MKIRVGPSARVALAVTAVLCLVVASLYSIAALTVRTNWFRNKVKNETIATIERTTGGQLRVGSFDFDWRTLTATFSGVTLRGTEPAHGPPLFHAGSIRLSLRIVSLLERNIDIASIVTEGSETYFLVRPDGSTNIPGPRMHREGIKDFLGDLLKLKIGHFEFRNAALITESKRVPFSAQGQGLQIFLAYHARPSRYTLALSSSELAVNAPQVNTFSGSLDIRAQLKPDEVRFERVTLNSGQSALYLRGSLTRLATPVADIQFKAKLLAEDVARPLGLTGLLRGEVRVDGGTHYGRDTSSVFKGNVSGKDIVYRSPGLHLNGASISFDAEGKRDGIHLGNVLLSDSGKSLAGSATLNTLGAFVFDGRVTRLGIRDAFREFRVASVPYDGAVSGPLRLTGKLQKGVREVELQAKLHISPGRNGIPISGDLNASYSERSHTLQITDSHIDSPNSHLILSGSPGAALQLKLSSTDLFELSPVLDALAVRSALPANLDLRRAGLSFDGQVKGKVSSAEITGDLSLARFKVNGMTWDALHSQVSVSSRSLEFKSLSATQGAFQVNASGSVALNEWSIRPDGQVNVQANFDGAGLQKIGANFHGDASGSLTLAGTASTLHGQGRFNVGNLDAYGERLKQVKFGASLNSNNLTVTSGRAQAGGAVVSFSGTYRHVNGDWTRGEMQMRIDTNAFPLATLSTPKALFPKLDARVEVHGAMRAQLAAGHLEPQQADGVFSLKRVTLDRAPLGDITVDAATHGEQLSVGVAGNLEGSPVSGNLRARLVDLEPGTGELHFGRLSLATIYDLAGSEAETLSLPDGFIHGGVSFYGPLLRPSQIKLQLRIDELEMDPPASHDGPVPTELAIHNVGPIIIDAGGGTAVVRSLQLGTRDTHLNVAGSFGYAGEPALHLNIDGSSDFRLFQIFDPNIQSSGLSVLKVSVGGTFSRPSIDGLMELHDGSLFVKNVTNGLTGVNGTIRFDRNRATIQTLTAQSGGGRLALAGFVSFGTPGPVVYNLQANATNVRVRYTGASVSADGVLQLAGSSGNGLVSGRLTVSRIIINQNSDVGNILASAATSAPAPGNEKDLISGLQLDLRVQSSSNLRVSTDLSQDVEADIDLRVRGTAAHPILLGSISANQGEIKVFGAKYSINRGDITFPNTVRIEPVLDLDLQTETRGITVDITVSGTLNKLNMNYRSDPPLQPRDIIALLTVGQAPSATANPSNIKANTDVSALQAGANTVLGQAVSPASNRLSKLFGITNIKIDPLVQGITNTPQARLTLEQQISRDITVTYVTNLAQTSEQVFRFEWALNRQFSVVAVRDDNGEFGIDFQYKRRFR